MTAKKKSDLSSLLALWPFVTPYKSRVVGALLALMLTALVTLAVGQGVRMIIDQGFIEQSMALLNRAVLFTIGLAVLMAIGSYSRYYLVSWLGERVAADIRRKVFDHLVHMHPSYFESTRSGEVMSRLTTDTTLLQTIVGTSLSMALRNVLTLVGALLMLIVTNYKLTLLVLVSVPIVLLPIVISGRRVRKLSRDSQDSIADVGSYAGEVLQNIKTVQSYTQEETEKRAFASEVERAFAVAGRRIRQRAILVAVVITLVFSALAGMVWVGGTDVISGRMSGGELGAFVFYAVLVASTVAALSEVWGDLQRASGASERLIELMRERPEIENKPSVVRATDLAPSLAFERVTFAYPTRLDQPALEDFSLLFPEGKITALVGPSGAGKSTIFELIQRFYDPQQGAILLGGTDLRKLEPADLRRQLAVVPQQPALFSNDVFFNIRYGRPEASDEEVMAAARAANAHDFIMRLPEQYSSHLGEGGVRLSGGQRQRMAIARAILKNPRLLLLDEATSALDSESEYQVQQALEVLMRDRTTLIIAHRLGTILHADNIVVMENGRPIASGTHAELLESSPLYQRLAKLQFRDDLQEVVSS